MKSLLLSLLPLSALAAPTYPETRKEAVVDDYFGTKVEDPYRWLEDDNAADTKAWIKAENEVTGTYLKSISQREAIRKRLAALWNYERIGMPEESGGKWFFSRNSGLQNQSVLMVADTADGEGRVLLDPNTLSKDGTVSLAGHEPSEDGRLLAYKLSSGGSDWQEIRVRDVATGKDLDDHLRWVKFSGISWARDGSGFYYSRFDAPPEGQTLTRKNEFQKFCFHKIGTKQEDDVIIYERKDQPNWNIGGGVTEDGTYLILNLQEGTERKNRVFYRDLKDPAAKVVELLNEADASYDFIDHVGTVFLFKTDLNAPLGRVIAIDVTKPAKSEWKEIIPETKHQLDAVSSVGGQLVCTYLQDAKSAVSCYDFTGKKLRDLELPGIGDVGGFGGRSKDKTTFYGFTGFTEPGSIHQLDLATGKSRLFRRPKVEFDSAAYETEQVFYPSKDGTRVPMFIVHKKGLVRDGTNPTLLYGYGGFNSTMTPGFSISRAVWLEMGGVLVVANLRGGGEYGREWHEAGTKLRKQNVFNDFIAAGEWLISNRITSREKLAIQGGSNGGLLVGACMTQRPELFAAALPAVGVMDMLRFQKFTIGWAWKSDYGSSENPEEFKALYAYSPYHNLRPGTRYPATLVTTSDHDDRVVPAHSFKFAARLQECQSKDGPPVLIRVESSAGHGAGTALAKMIEKTADEWAFLAKSLGMEPKW